MSRAAAIDRAERHFDEGAFRELLARRIAMPTESQNPERAGVLADYLELLLDGLVARLAAGQRVDNLTPVLDLVEASVRIRR